MRPINPANGEPLQERTPLSLQEGQDIAALVKKAAKKWSRQSFAFRAKVLIDVAACLRTRAKSLATFMAEEMGKPLENGYAEIEKCAVVCEYYAEHAQRFLEEEQIATEGSRSSVVFEPLGTVLAIMPWNFPYWQVFRFAAPALMAGNTIVLKHASNVQGCAEAIDALFLEATGQSNLLKNVFLSNDDTESLIEHASIDAVTLTGSTRAGRSVAARCGAALKKAVLELGGSDPYIVLADAKVDEAAKICVKSRLVNNGQSCIAAKRFIVVKEIRSKFEECVVQHMNAKKMGDPLDPATELGPMARMDLRDELHRQVVKSISCGAKRLLGGEIPDKPGAWYPPTVLSKVGPGMPAYDDELFGPVASIIEAEGEEDAIRIANDSSFGLGSAIFSKNIERAQQFIPKIAAGACFINSHVRSDPRLPFGGIKQSGYGRELSSFGIREFVNIKTVYVK